MNKRLFFAVTAACFVLFSCSSTNPRYVHSPAAYNPNFFRQRGDFKLSGSVSASPGTLFSNIEEDDGFDDKAVGFDGQAAAAVTDHFLVSLGGTYRDDKDRFNNDDISSGNNNSRIHYTRRVFDLGVGFYTPVASGRHYFNVMLGAGIGSMNSIDQGYLDGAVTRTDSYRAAFMKYSLTPAFNFFFSEYFRLSTAPRFSLMRFNNIRSSYSAENEDRFGYTLLRKKAVPVFEPSVALQAGFKNVEWLKVDMGFNFSTNPVNADIYSDSEDAYKVRSRNMLITLGLTFYPLEGKR